MGPGLDILVDRGRELPSMRVLEKGREKGFLRSILSLLLDRRSVLPPGKVTEEEFNCK